MPVDFEIQLPIHLAGVEAASAPGVQKPLHVASSFKKAVAFGLPCGAVRVLLRVAVTDPVELASSKFLEARDLVRWGLSV
eukprot:7080538-Pyramimonas_sp.AAC.1